MLSFLEFLNPELPTAITNTGFFIHMGINNILIYLCHIMTEKRISIDSNFISSLLCLIDYDIIIYYIDFII